ncbi:MAG: hypothetical protein WCJ95_20595 [Mariniphaga sp.]
MESKRVIRRHEALKEFEVKETPGGEPVTFSIKFVKKNGELVFYPRAIAAGLRFNMNDKRMRGVLPVDFNNMASGHVTPVHIDSIVEWNGKQIKL